MAEYARDSDPETSQDAAAEVAAMDLRAVHRALLFALDSSHPYALTDHQAADAAIQYYGASGLEREGVRRRMGDLRGKLGWARWRTDYAGRIQRDGRRGLSELTDKGHLAVQDLTPKAQPAPGQLL